MDIELQAILDASSSSSECSRLENCPRQFRLTETSTTAQHEHNNYNDGTANNINNNNSSGTSSSASLSLGDESAIKSSPPFTINYLSQEMKLMDDLLLENQRLMAGLMDMDMSGDDTSSVSL